MDVEESTGTIRDGCMSDVYCLMVHPNLELEVMDALIGSNAGTERLTTPTSEST